MEIARLRIYDYVETKSIFIVKNCKIYSLARCNIDSAIKCIFKEFIFSKRECLSQQKFFTKVIVHFVFLIFI